MGDAAACEMQKRREYWCEGVFSEKAIAPNVVIGACFQPACWLVSMNLDGK